MAIFLDYVTDKDKGVILILIKEESGFLHTYYENELDDAVAMLATPGHIVTWGRPSFYLERTLTQDQYPILEDIPIKPRWFDIFSIIRADTGLEPSLTKTAQACLGFGPQSEVADLPSDLQTEATSYLIDQLTDRLNILVELYNYIKLHGEVSFYHRTGEYTVEVSAVEPSILSD